MAPTGQTNTAHCSAIVLSMRRSFFRPGCHAFREYRAARAFRILAEQFRIPE
jgi:hypothetical protein